MELAVAAVALLAPYLARAGESVAGEAGEAMAAAMKRLYDFVRRRFEEDNDAAARQTLERLEERPELEERQHALAGVLAEKAKSNPAFVDELRRLVYKATEGRPLNEFLTQVYGGEVGKIVNIGQVENASF